MVWYYSFLAVDLSAVQLSISSLTFVAWFFCCIFFTAEQSGEGEQSNKGVSPKRLSHLKEENQDAELFQFPVSVRILDNSCTEKLSSGRMSLSRKSYATTMKLLDLLPFFLFAVQIWPRGPWLVRFHLCYFSLVLPPPLAAWPSTASPSLA